MFSDVRSPESWHVWHMWHVHLWHWWHELHGVHFWHLSPDAGLLRHEEVHLWHSWSELGHVWNVRNESLWLTPFRVQSFEAHIKVLKSMLDLSLGALDLPGNFFLDFSLDAVEKIDDWSEWASLVLWPVSMNLL